MYKDGDGYKHFISEKEFNGSIINLTKEIVEAFVDEEIGQSELGEFYNIAGIVKTEEYGDFIFNQAKEPNIYVKIETDGILEEEIIKEIVLGGLFRLRKIASENMKLDKDINIKATYTLAYS